MGHDPVVLDGSAIHVDLSVHIVGGADDNHTVREYQAKRPPTIVTGNEDDGYVRATGTENSPFDGFASQGGCNTHQTQQYFR